MYLTKWLSKTVWVFGLGQKPRKNSAQCRSLLFGVLALGVGEEFGEKKGDTPPREAAQLGVARHCRTRL